MADDNREPFVAILCVEGVVTGDGRYLEPGQGSWRDLPLDIYSKDVISPGHDGAGFAGQLTSIRMDGRRMIGEGWFDLDTEVGAETARRVGNETTRFVSIDMADADVVVEPVFDDDGEMVDTIARFGPYKIMGATVTSHPAIEQAVVWLQSMPAPAEAFCDLPEPLGDPAPMPDMGDVIILASGDTSLPPAAWFDDPHLSELTPLTITDDGRVYGHIAPWGCCHIGYPGQCVEPPQGSDYSRFLVGARRTAEGIDVPTGTITAFGGHADDSLGEAGARAHHDDVSLACADVNVGEDRHGIWVAGALRSGVTDEQIEIMRASTPSGDWRPIGGRLELINVHYVNTPGFPVPRLRARIASGEVVALVASVPPTPDAVTEETVASTPPDAETTGDTPPEAQHGTVERGTSEALPPALDSVLAPYLDAQRDEILERHPAPPEPSPLASYLASRSSTEPDG